MRSFARIALLLSGALLPGCDGPADGGAPIPLVVHDPYSVRGEWYKANFHLHSTHSHGRLGAADLVNLYHRNGYDVLSITDHNMFGDQDGGVLSRFYQMDSILHDWNGDGTLHPDSIFGSGVEAYVRDWTRPPPAWRSDRWFRPPDARIEDIPLVLSGCEASYAYFGAHFGLIGYPPGAIDPPGPGFDWLDPLQRVGGFAYVAHPGSANEIPDLFMSALPISSFQGIEIVNGARLTRGEVADATPLWDALLSRGHRLWGLANDDAHKLPGEDELFPFTAFDMLLCARPTTEEVLAALHRGSFYASTGLRFEELRLVGATLWVEAPGARRIRFIGRDGRCLREQSSSRGVYVIQGDEGYVRVEALGDRIDAPRSSWLQAAWSQPFWIGTRSTAMHPSGSHDVGE